MEWDKIAGFLAGHARLLDRRRFELLRGTGSPPAVLAALDGYRNPDGGYGWGIEPDLRDPSSQPAGALHAFEVLAEVPSAGTRAVALADWLQSVTRPDGGLPFALPVGSAHAVAPFWAGADHDRSSLHITAAVAAAAVRVPGLAGHPWVRDSVEYCLGAIDALTERPFAIEYSYCLQLLDALSDAPGFAAADALDRLHRLGEWLPSDGLLPVPGGAEGEALRPLDIAPWPDRPVRRLFPPELIAAELHRLAAGQRDDGGWLVDFDSYSDAAAIEWRGYATVRAVTVLLANDVVSG